MPPVVRMGRAVGGEDGLGSGVGVEDALLPLRPLVVGPPGRIGPLLINVEAQLVDVLLGEGTVEDARAGAAHLGV
eukprot:14593512-Alexandrium_andersonii.AAC.1